MSENPFQTKYDEGFADGEEAAKLRIAELEAENSTLKLRNVELEADAIGNLLFSSSLQEENERLQSELSDYKLALAAALTE